MSLSAAKMPARGWCGGRWHVASLALIVSSCLLNPQPDDPGNGDDKKNATNGESPGTKPDVDYGASGGATLNGGAEAPFSGGAGALTESGWPPDAFVAGAASRAVGCASLGIAGNGAGVAGTGSTPNCATAGTSAISSH